jgi:hypothetical protein
LLTTALDGAAITSIKFEIFSGVNSDGKLDKIEPFCEIEVGISLLVINSVTLNGILEGISKTSPFVSVSF